jgi:DNA-binding HxlR family transcriptional regulator
VHFALEVFGDAWSLLIVRDLMFEGRTSYSELLAAEEGIATNVLADRLTRLEEDGIIAKRDDGRYRLTAKGLDLLPVMLELIAWSARYDKQTKASRTFVRRVRTDRARLEAEIRAGHAK